MSSGAPSGDGGGGGSGREPRMPKDMGGLLRLCAETAGSAGPSENVSLQPMSAERRDWLEKALTDMTVSPVEEMKKAIRVIQNTESDSDDIIGALETLIEWCENLDFAIDFHKIGGFVIFALCLESAEAEVRWQCLDLAATLVQNNPYCQKVILEHGLLPTMLVMLDTDADSTVKTKAMYAVSCLTRECQEALDMFISHNGFSILMRAMQTDVEKLKLKSAFLLSSICSDSNKCKDIICDMGLIDQLVGHLSEEHTSFHEHAMSALLAVVRGHVRSVQECLRDELNLVTLLKQRQNDLKGKEEFEEEYEYTTELLELLSRGEDNTEDTIIR